MFDEGFMYLLAVLLILGLFIFQVRGCAECERRGGAYVQSMGLYQCVKRVGD